MTGTTGATRGTIGTASRGTIGIAGVMDEANCAAMGAVMGGAIAVTAGIEVVASHGAGVGSSLLLEERVVAVREE